MLYPIKPLLESFFIASLLLLPAIQAAAGDLPQQQVNQLQSQMTATNEKIATLASDNQRMKGTISTLENSLNTANHEISDLKSMRQQRGETSAEPQRTANGHGRGGRRGGR